MDTAHARILALDFGKRRIGLAVSDELGITAQGLDTLIRTNKRADLESLRRMALLLGARLILVGDPLRMSGEAGVQSGLAHDFAEELRKYTGLEVRFWDERLTSREAERTLRGSGVANDKRKATIDRLSAVILLQSYLDSLAIRNAAENPA